MQSYAIPAAASAAMARYGNIIFLDRPAHDGDLFSRRHPAMTRLNRAKIFAPFAALVGFDERVRRKEIRYVAKVELDADEEWELNRKLLILHERTANSKLARTHAVVVKVEYYAVCTDNENDAYMEKGQYLTVTGRVQEQLEHGRKGLPVFVSGANVTGPCCWTGEHVIHPINAFHGIEQRAFSQGKRDHLRRSDSFSEYGKLQIHAPAEQVIVQMGNEALHRYTLVGKSRRFDVDGPLGHVV